jgi:hypothetical protein
MANYALIPLVEHFDAVFCGNDGQQYGAFILLLLSGCGMTEPECASADTRASVIKIVSGNSNNALCSRYLAWPSRRPTFSGIIDKRRRSRLGFHNRRFPIFFVRQR